MESVGMIVFYGGLILACIMMLVAVLDYACRRFWVWYLKRKAEKEK